MVPVVGTGVDPVTSRFPNRMAGEMVPASSRCSGPQLDAIIFRSLKVLLEPTTELSIAQDHDGHFVKCRETLRRSLDKRPSPTIGLWYVILCQMRRFCAGEPRNALCLVGWSVRFVKGRAAHS
jgi:hypothetical protein